MIYLFTMILYSISLISLKGTLVIIIPTMDGIIIAADSRVTVNDKYFDIGDKIKIIDKTGIAFFSTGTSKFYPYISNTIITEEWLKNVKPIFDCDEIVKEYLLNKNITKLESNLIIEIEKYIVNKFRDFMSQGNERLKKYISKDLCQFVFAQYNSSLNTSEIFSFKIIVNDIGEVKYSNHIAEFIKVNDHFALKVYGENEYFDKYVLKGIGRKYFNEKYFAVIKDSPYINKINGSNGAYLAWATINAASRTTEIVRPRSGIGGEIKMFILNNSNEKYRKLDIGKDF